MSVYSHISCNYASSHLCISGTLCGHIKGSARFFFLRTDLCTCEHAVFGFIQNSCCVAHTTVLWPGQVERTTPHSFRVGRRGCGLQGHRGHLV